MNLKAACLLRAASYLKPGATIVEIGSIRSADEVPSDGFSTYYLGIEAAKRRWIVHTIDIDPAAVGHAASLGISQVHAHQADGVTWLNQFAGVIDLLYLDGAADPAQAASQYYAAPLAPDGIVVVDDVQPIDDRRRGKGDELLSLLELEGFDVAIHRTEPGYEMAVATR